MVVEFLIMTLLGKVTTLGYLISYLVLVILAVIIF